MLVTLTALVLSALLPVQDPGEVIPAFLDSIMTDNTGAAMDMLSSRAIGDADSVLANHPRQVDAMLAFFGLSSTIRESATCGAELLEGILGSPSLKAGILLMGLAPGPPVQSGDDMYVPVEYGLPGARDTLFFQLVTEEGRWRIRDFFDYAPEVPGLPRG